MRVIVEGRPIIFEGDTMPSPEDIDFAADQLGIPKPSQNTKPAPLKGQIQGPPDPSSLYASPNALNRGLAIQKQLENSSANLKPRSPFDFGTTITPTKPVSSPPVNIDNFVQGLQDHVTGADAYPSLRPVTPTPPKPQTGIPAAPTLSELVKAVDAGHAQFQANAARDAQAKNAAYLEAIHAGDPNFDSTSHDALGPRGAMPQTSDVRVQGPKPNYADPQTYIKALKNTGQALGAGAGLAGDIVTQGPGTFLRESSEQLAKGLGRSPEDIKEVGDISSKSPAVQFAGYGATSLIPGAAFALGGGLLAKSLGHSIEQGSIAPAIDDVKNLGLSVYPDYLNPNLSAEEKTVRTGNLVLLVLGGFHIAPHVIPRLSEIGQIAAERMNATLPAGDYSGFIKAYKLLPKPDEDILDVQAKTGLSTHVIYHAVQALVAHINSGELNPADVNPAHPYSQVPSEAPVSPASPNAVVNNQGPGNPGRLPPWKRTPRSGPAIDLSATPPTDIPPVESTQPANSSNADIADSVAHLHGLQPLLSEMRNSLGHEEGSTKFLDDVNQHIKNGNTSLALPDSVSSDIWRQNNPTPTPSEPVKVWTQAEALADLNSKLARIAEQDRTGPRYTEETYNKAKQFYLDEYASRIKGLEPQPPVPDATNPVKVTRGPRKAVASTPTSETPASAEPIPVNPNNLPVSGQPAVPTLEPTNPRANIGVQAVGKEPPIPSVENAPKTEVPKVAPETGATTTEATEPAPAIKPATPTSSTLITDGINAGKYHNVLSDGHESITDNILDELNTPKPKPPVRANSIEGKAIAEKTGTAVAEPPKVYPDEVTGDPNKGITGHSRTIETERGYNRTAPGTLTDKARYVEAKRQIDAGKDPVKLSNDLANQDRPPSAVESEIVKQGMAKAESDMISAKADMDAESDPALKSLHQSRLLEATDRLNTLRINDAYSSWLQGLTLRARASGIKLGTGDFAQIVKTKMSRVLGRDLNARENAGIDAHLKVVEDLQKQLDAENTKSAKTDAGKNVDKTAREVRSEGRQQTIDELSQEAQDALNKAHKAISQSGLGSGPGQALLDAAPHIKDYAKALIKQGIVRLEDITDRIITDFKARGIDLSKTDVHEVLAGRHDPEGPKRTRSDWQNIVSDSRKQLKDLEDAYKKSPEGIRAKLADQLNNLKTKYQASPTGQREAISNQIKDLQKSLNDGPVAERTKIKGQIDAAKNQLQQLIAENNKDTVTTEAAKSNKAPGVAFLEAKIAAEKAKIAFKVREAGRDPINRNLANVQHFLLLSGPAFLAKLAGFSAYEFGTSWAGDLASQAAGHLPVSLRDPFGPKMRDLTSTEGHIGKTLLPGQSAGDLAKLMGQDAVQKLRTGANQMDVEYKNVENPTYANRLHGAEKSPLQRYFLQKSLNAQVKALTAKGIEITPEHSLDIGLKAYNDSLEGILQNDNEYSKQLNRIQAVLESKGTGGQAVSALLQLTKPVARFSSNAIGRGVESGTGLLQAAVKYVAGSLKEGGMTPAESEQVLKLIRRGTVPAALMLLTWYKPDWLKGSGYYTPAVKMKNDERPGEILAGGHSTGAMGSHIPQLEGLQWIASVRNAIDEGKPWSTGPLAILSGLTQKVPGVGPASQMVTAMSKPDGGAEAGKQSARMLSQYNPYIIQAIAKAIDPTVKPNVLLNPNQPGPYDDAGSILNKLLLGGKESRKAAGFMDQGKLGFPKARETVPLRQDPLPAGLGISDPSKSLQRLLKLPKAS